MKNPESSLQEMVEEAYESTLKPFHGWISSAAYRVALRLIPERDIFIELLMGNCQDTGDFGEDVMILVSIVQPLLEEINVIYRCLRCICCCTCSLIAGWMYRVRGLKITEAQCISCFSF